MSVVAEARRAARSEWVDRAARLGLVAKAVLYGVIGVLALAIPLGLGGRPADKQGALRTVSAQPLGGWLLLVLGAGLAGYALWRFTQAFLDRDGEGSGVKGLAKRIGYFARGVLYTVSSVAAFMLAFGLGKAHSDEKEETARVLELPLGRWAVAVGGGAFLVAGAYNGIRSLTRGFRDHLREHELSEKVRGWVIAVGVLGHAARAVVFTLIGVFLLRAAIQYDPREAVGIDGALRKLAEQTYGEALLGVVAAGLIAYGLYCLVQARYREV
jgi:hypothetical protein